MASTGIERGGGDEEQPLLRHRRPPFHALNLQHWYSSPIDTERWAMQSTREKVKRFLSSKAGHYSVLTLVSLDVLGMIADFVLRLFQCEQGKSSYDWDLALDILGALGLGFSCLFMVELIASIWAFGYGYFTSWFHCFDAFIVVAGFVTDVVLHGVIEEVASFIVVLRLWRVVKIIEELGVGEQERAEESQRRIDELGGEVDLLRKELAGLKQQLDKSGVHVADDGMAPSSR
uniref:Voltage-gated hydrogen channel 1 n=1 Tax=Bionectria ochroleuca TaxID=29856 RepID=A0A8H7NHR8_BIOOC